MPFNDGDDRKPIDVLRRALQEAGIEEYKPSDHTLPRNPTSLFWREVSYDASFHLAETDHDIELMIVYNSLPGMYASVRLHRLAEELTNTDIYSNDDAVEALVCVFEFMRDEILGVFRRTSENLEVRRINILSNRLRKPSFRALGRAHRDFMEKTFKPSREKANSAAKLRLERTGPGRPTGVRNRKTAGEFLRENEEHRRSILKAMCKLYRKAKARTNELLAEDAIKKTSVAYEMNISRSTLATWLISGGYDFDELKEEAIAMCSRN